MSLNRSLMIQFKFTEDKLHQVIVEYYLKISYLRIQVLFSPKKNLVISILYFTLKVNL